MPRVARRPRALRFQLASPCVAAVLLAGPHVPVAARDACPLKPVMVYPAPETPADGR